MKSGGPFPIPTPADWRAEAEMALKGRPVEGLVHLDADHLATRPRYGRANGIEADVAPLPTPMTATGARAARV